ncbi:MAG: hypothetical protein ACRC6T_14035 [Sarcina sp.]
MFHINLIILFVNANNYYLIKKVDTQIGKELSKSEVTVFTVKAEIDTPTINYTVSKDGMIELAWNEVEGAESYTVCKIYRSEENGKNSYRLSEISKTKKNRFGDFS